MPHFCRGCFPLPRKCKLAGSFNAVSAAHDPMSHLIVLCPRAAAEETTLRLELLARILADLLRDALQRTL